MLKPPFVILPIIGGLGIAIALIYWILTIVRRPQQKTLKSVAVTHVASRPDYAAGFGTPPPAPAAPAPPPSAWADVIPQAPAAPPVTPEPPVEEPPVGPSEAGGAAPAEPFAATADEPSATPADGPPADPAAAPDEPPDFPEPVDY
jgi:hypothetical protein